MGCCYGASGRQANTGSSDAKQSVDTIEYKKTHEILLHLDLVEWLQSADMQAVRDYLVVDVRTEDFVGGNIVNAVNVRYDEFIEQIPSIINKYYGTKHLVFHCMYSQKRGPDAVEWYCRAMSALLRADRNEIHKLIEYESEEFHALYDVLIALSERDEPQIQCLKRQKVYLLHGGFSAFVHKLGSDSQWIEHFDHAHWMKQDDWLQHIAELL